MTQSCCQCSAHRRRRPCLNCKEIYLSEHILTKFLPCAKALPARFFGGLQRISYNWQCCSQAVSRQTDGRISRRECVWPAHNHSEGQPAKSSQSILRPSTYGVNSAVGGHPGAMYMRHPGNYSREGLVKRFFFSQPKNALPNLQSVSDLASKKKFQKSTYCKEIPHLSCLTTLGKVYPIVLTAFSIPTSNHSLTLDAWRVFFWLNC